MIVPSIIEGGQISSSNPHMLLLKAVDGVYKGACTCGDATALHGTLSGTTLLEVECMHVWLLELYRAFMGLDHDWLHGDISVEVEEESATWIDLQSLRSGDCIGAVLIWSYYDVTFDISLLHARVTAPSQLQVEAGSDDDEVLQTASTPTARLYCCHPACRTMVDSCRHVRYALEMGVVDGCATRDLSHRVAHGLDDDGVERRLRCFSKTAPMLMDSEIRDVDLGGEVILADHTCPHPGCGCEGLQV